jgi:hypothetical protein
MFWNRKYDRVGVQADEFESSDKKIHVCVCVCVCVCVYSDFSSWNELWILRVRYKMLIATSLL